jgi:hypothetical protein
MLVHWLTADGWTIVRTADTDAREHGIDVEATRDGVRLGVEVKGYPSRYYVRGPRQGEMKPTPPNLQAKMWYSHALVPAMRLRGEDPDARSVMAFPDFEVYRALWRDTSAALRAAHVEVWLVHRDGAVSVLR